MSKQSSLNVYVTIHCHIWTFIFLCTSTSRDKMILLVLNILGESLKITAIVTVPFLPLPLDLAQKPRNMFGIPQVKESMENRDVFLRNWYWETCSHPAPWNALWMKLVKVNFSSTWAVPGKPDTGTSFLLVLRSFPSLLQMKEPTELFPETLKKPTSSKNSIL